MANLKSLAKDTALYGLSSIVGRFLNYFLVPLYTHVIPAANGGYGVVTNIYGFTAFFMVILTFGMETTFFRYANKEEENPDTVFSTAFGVVTGLSLVFLTIINLFISPISEILGYTDHHSYIQIMAAVVAIDAIQALPFCLLRFQKKALKFAILKLLFITLNIGLNLFYYLYLGCQDVIYIFAVNLACTAVISFFFIPELSKIKWHFDFALLKRMLTYSWPILLLGMVGILNQTVDKMIYPIVLDDVEEAKVQLGVYGSCFKIAMIMGMITMAFRYAYEPFVFAQSKDKDKNETYAITMKYFIIFTLLAFLCVIAYIDVIQLILGKDYREAIGVVPIVMAAEIMMGIYFNLSFWYKLIDKTIYGAWFSIAGCVVLMSILVIYIPIYGYWACAWGGLAGYGTSMLLSYFVGQKKNPIKYPLKSIGIYVALTAVLYIAMILIPQDWSLILKTSVNSILLGIFVSYILIKDFPVKAIISKLRKR
ncbi:MAG: oligosaccharide flippase family protein [Bacteroidales bacterium]|nr:oligosaccharide flippase family protein [Bacteroidales bacterium]